MTWTMWIVYFGINVPPSAFERYDDAWLCQRLASEVVIPVMQERNIPMAVICLPTREQDEPDKATPFAAPKKLRGQA